MKGQAVAIRYRRELGLILSWLAFPLVPVVLEDFYYQTCNLNVFSNAKFGPDPARLGLVDVGPDAWSPARVWFSCRRDR